MSKNMFYLYETLKIQKDLKRHMLKLFCNLVTTKLSSNINVIIVTNNMFDSHVFADLKSTSVLIYNL